MPKQVGHSKVKSDLQAFLVCVGIGAVLMLVIGVIFYFMNQNSDFLPEAKPGSPVENKPTYR
jgi:hypothetical protein